MLRSTMSSQRTERELRQSRSRLRVLANIDMLTQVPNRRRFEELARRALQSDEDGSAALLLVDIDHFKQINDQLGHAAGDRALKLVSRCTLELLRSNDVAGRHGGDEFVMVLRATSPGDARHVFERVRQMIASRAWQGVPTEMRLTASVGVAIGTGSFDSSRVLAEAATALQQAKRDYWSIESVLHYRLDEVLEEDKSRVRSPKAAHVLGMFRRLAVSLFAEWRSRDAKRKRATMTDLQSHMGAEHAAPAMRFITARYPAFKTRS